MEYRWIRSSRRTVGLEITADLQVVLRTPYFCTRAQADRFVEEHAQWIERHRQSVRRRQETLPTSEVSPEEEKRLRTLAAETLPAKVKRYAEIMGVTPTGITITSARKRYGSCSGKNRLCFSWRLMQYPDEAVDYVVVHELAHIRHHNHGADFYGFVERILPDWKQRQRLLR